MIVRATHQGGMQFFIETPANELIADRGDDEGFSGAGPMPGEYMICAMASCFGQAILYVASRMRKELSGLRVEVDGVKDMKLFRLSSVTIRVGSDSPEETLRKVVATAKKYCFVTNSLSADIPLNVIVGDV